jgi:hypothetical protein
MRHPEDVMNEAVEYVTRAFPNPTRDDDLSRIRLAAIKAVELTTADILGEMAPRVFPMAERTVRNRIKPARLRRYTLR